MLKKEYVFICFNIFALVQQIHTEYFYSAICLHNTAVSHTLHNSIQGLSLQGSNDFMGLF